MPTLVSKRSSVNSTSSAVAHSGYAALLRKVQEVLAEGRARAKRALEWEEVRTWWEAAKVVNDDLRIHDGRAGYGEEAVKYLAAGLHVGSAYLYDILRFQTRFNILHSSVKLTLTHYRVLSQIKNKKERELLYRKAVREHLSVPGLMAEIRSRKLLEAGAGLRPSPVSGSRLVPAGVKSRHRPLPLLIPRRGKFFTYRIVKSWSLHPGPGFHSIDLGFRNRHTLKLTGIRSPRVGDIVEAIRTRKDPRGDRYRFKRVGGDPRAARRLLYTYQAYVTEVIDDDTLWANKDLGFRFDHEDKFRFRGIDAAEIEKGKPASDYVKRVLAQVPFVVLTVTGRDKFGRPLIDVFYLKGTDDREKVLREGIYLNQQLLDLSLAKRV